MTRDNEIKQQNEDVEKQKQLILTRDNEIKQQNEQKIIHLQNTIRDEKIKNANINKDRENTVSGYTQPILQNKAAIKQQEQQEIDMVKQSSQIKQEELNNQVIDMIQQLENNIKNIDSKKNELYQDLQVNKEALNSLKSIMK